MKILLQVDPVELEQHFEQEDDDEAAEDRAWVKYLYRLERRALLTETRQAGMEIQKLPSGKFRVDRVADSDPGLTERAAGRVLHDWSPDVPDKPDAPFVLRHISKLRQLGNGDALKVLKSLLAEFEE